MAVQSEILTRPKPHQYSLPDALDNIFQIRNVDAVSQYILPHPHLPGLLLRVRQELLSYFGNDSAMSLELFTSRESDDDTALLLRVQTRQEPEVALQQLFEFDTEWWLKQPEADLSGVIVDVEYI